MADETLWHSQLDELRRSLSIPKEDLDVEFLIPVFVPAGFLEGGKWPGPCVQLRARDLAIVWAILRPHNTMIYVVTETSNFWESNGIQWREKAMDNLERFSENNVTTHHFSRTDGTVYSVVMMHDDGVGPSRLLLNGSIEQIFPEGYYVAIPERSVGIVLSRNVTDDERLKIDELVEKCFKDGTAPVSPLMFDPDELAVA